MGPLFPGAPWLSDDELWSQKPQSIVRQAFLAEFESGPPVTGAPWFAGFPDQEEGTVGQGGTPKPQDLTRGKPFLNRVPDPTDTRRMARSTEVLSQIVNSLIAQGILIQTGPSEWTIQLPE